LPHALGLLAQAPYDLRELLAAAFGLQAIYRHDTRQATTVLTVTETTPVTVNAILADLPTDHDTANGAVKPAGGSPSWGQLGAGLLAAFGGGGAVRFVLG
jgi:hypothetical protein